MSKIEVENLAKIPGVPRGRCPDLLGCGRCCFEGWSFDRLYTCWKWVHQERTAKGDQNEADEIIYKNPPGVDHCRHHPRYCRFHQNQFADRSSSIDAFHYLDHFLRNPHRDNHLVRVGL